MSKGFSAAQVRGVLGRDPDIRATPSGAKVANFSLAVERGFGDKAVTDWRAIVAWGSLADFVEKYLKKGKAVYVSGELQDRSWDDKQTGAKRTVTEIRADRIEFADTGNAPSGGGDRPSRQERSAPAPRQQAAPQTRSTEPAGHDDPFGEEPTF
jgi:single-strand DNA-binding protein